MFARPKINQLLANFKKKPVQTRPFSVKINDPADNCPNLSMDSSVIIDFLSLNTKTQNRYGKQITSFSY